MKRGNILKRIIIVLILTIIISFGSIYSQELGDVNNDNQITIVDALLVSQEYVGLTPAALTNPERADVDCNDFINIIDALLISQVYVGLLTDFPCNLIPELKLQYQCLNTQENTEIIQVNVLIKNIDVIEADLGLCEIQYCYNKEGKAEEIPVIKYADAGIQNTFVTLFPGAPGLASITFKNTAGKVPAGGTSIVNFTIVKLDNSLYDQSNDFSWDSTYINYADYRRMGLFYSDSLIWGFVCPTPEPTPKPQSVNIALNKFTKASSTEKDFLSKHAVDGEFTTRWSSLFADNQWWLCDLERYSNIEHVMIYWEAAFTKAYTLQVSDDQSLWTDIYQHNNGDGGIDGIPCEGFGRFFRIYCTERGTEWGNSFFELEIYGSQIGPEPYFEYLPLIVVNGMDMTFNASGSIYTIDAITEYLWDFGDGTSGSGSIITHSYTAAGTYIVSLTILASDSTSSGMSKEIIIYSPEPKIVFNWNRNVPDADELVTFSTKGSWDPDGTIVGYSWDFGDGSSGTGETINHSFSSDGFYTISLTLTDNDDNTATLLKNLVVDSRFAPPIDVLGNQIIDANGKSLYLRGFNIADPIYHNNEQEIIHYKNDWKVELIRIPLITERWWDVDSEKQEEYLIATENVVRWCRENKIYVIFDGWHEGGQGNVHQDFPKAKDAWHLLLPKFKDENHILWEVYNEPHDILWSDWVPMAEELVDIIRSYNPVATACIVPGVDWAQIAEVDNVAVAREKIIYAWHPYPHVYSAVWDDTTWDTNYGFIVNNGYAPVIADEWGFPLFDKGDRLYYGEVIINYFKSRGISYTAWLMYPWGETLIYEKWPDELRTEFGDLVFEDLNGLWP